jgi:predicted cobalt transporter CbtA
MLPRWICSRIFDCEAMWIAETSTSDGIAIVLFATVLFLILFGIVAIVKWIFRLITGKPDPTKLETLVLVLKSKMHEGNVEPDNYEKIRIFAFYLRRFQIVSE